MLKLLPRHFYEKERGKERERYQREIERERRKREKKERAENEGVETGRESETLSPSAGEK